MKDSQYQIEYYHDLIFCFPPKAKEEKEAERLDIEEKYSSLQEEAAGKSRKLKKVWAMLQSSKSELADLQVCTYEGSQKLKKFQAKKILKIK